MKIEPKHILIGCISQRGEAEETRALLSGLVQVGAGLLLVKNSSPVALARNMLFTRIIDELPKDTERRILLLLDDDMAGTVANAIKLCEHSWRTGNACSGAYVQPNGKLQGRKIEQPITLKESGEYFVTTWETGLGAFAMPLVLLSALCNSETRVAHPAYPPGVFPLCQMGRHPRRPDEWASEDAWLCQSLPPPVQMLPIPFGHVRPLTLWPDANQLADLGAGYDAGDDASN